jgi:protein-L-isoaspartate(D-aspartate) O-methyltransferase
MAWFSHGKDNNDLISTLHKNKLLKSTRICEAMKKVDRGDFSSKSPYADSPQYIGHGATISAPHMHAYALEILEEKLQDGCTALDVGSGSGYLCAVMAYLVGEKGKVVGIEHIKELVDLSIKNISKHHEELLKSNRLLMIHGDGRKGYKQCAPYDCIHVGAAAESNIPPILCEQLKEGGIMVTPVETNKIFGDQIFRIYRKTSGKITHKDLLPVRYVPLTDADKQV